MTKKWSFEIGIPVSDYIQNYDDDEVAFLNAREDEIEARRQAKSEIKSLIKNTSKVKITNVVFQEFDSGNVGHAVAYWLIKVSGPSDVITELEAAYENRYK